MEQEIMKPDIDKTVASFIALTISKSDNPFQLLSHILNHPFLNEKWWNHIVRVRLDHLYKIKK